MHVLPVIAGVVFVLGGFWLLAWSLAPWSVTATAWFFRRTWWVGVALVLAAGAILLVSSLHAQPVHRCGQEHGTSENCSPTPFRV